MSLMKNLKQNALVMNVKIMRILTKQTKNLLMNALVLTVRIMKISIILMESKIVLKLTVQMIKIKK